MFFILSKLFSFITDPTFWIVSCFIISILLRKKLWKRITCIAGISFFVLLGNGALISLAEQCWTRNVVKPLPEGVVFDYALIQGGFGDFNHVTGQSQLFEEAERLIEPVRLYHAGRVRKLYIAGDGTISVANKRYPANKQAFITYMASLGVPEQDLILESESRNTRQSAKRTKELLGIDFDGRNSLLVTTAVHLPRTIKCYRKVGINPIPFATSVPIPYKMDITNLSLGSGNLFRWQKLIHEWFGFVSYKVAGFI